MPQKILLLSLTARATFGTFCRVLVLLGAGRQAAGINGFRALQILGLDSELDRGQSHILVLGQEKLMYYLRGATGT